MVYTHPSDHQGLPPMTSARAGWLVHYNDPDLGLFDEASLDELFAPDSGVRFEVPAERSPHTDALDTACLAARQTGRWGPAEHGVDNSEPRLARAIEAAEAAADAGGGQREAIAAAITVLAGPEAAEAFGLTT